MSASVPWWWSAAISPLVSVLAVLITQWMAGRREGRRMDFEWRKHVAEQRSATYKEFFDAADRLRRFENWTQATERARVVEEFRTATSSAGLVGEEPVREAAHVAARAADRLAYVAPGNPPESAVVNEARDELDDAVEATKKAMRDELGLSHHAGT